MSARALRRLNTYAQRERTANKLFTGHPDAVRFLASAPTIAAVATFGGLPEIIFIGRANVGKSTLLNQIVKRNDMAHTSTAAGRTRALNFYRIRPKRPGNDLVLVDAPGYGHRGRPEWGALFEYYIQNRTELRRAYILINAEHGVTEDDKLMLHTLELESRERQFTVQAVLTKTDKVPQPLLPQVMAERQRVISENAPSCLPAIMSAAGKHRFGTQELRHSILEINYRNIIKSQQYKQGSTNAPSTPF